MTTWRERVQLLYGPGILAGVDRRDWQALRKENGAQIDACYRRRARAIAANSLVNAAYRRREERDFLPKILQSVVQPPLFILGHWRSGTTHLHNLLSLDPQFAFPGVYQTSFPHTFLTTEARSSKLLGMFLPATRPMDDVKLSFQAPNEDEFALCTTTFLSPYMSWIFPRRADYYDRYLTFEGVPEDETARWTAALSLFLQKLTWKYDRPLILKSPTHTCRIGMLLNLFPQARFVHIHRNPYTVFQSTRHTDDKMVRLTTLQKPPAQDDDRRLLNRYKAMYDRFFEERPLIPEGQFHEVCFEELDRDPLGQIGALYERLNIPHFGAIEAELRRYLESVSDYKKNRFQEMAPALKAEIDCAWSRCFEEWGYGER